MGGTMNKFAPFLCLAIAACANTGFETLDEFAEGSKPKFPSSERAKGREGWVIVSYKVTESGNIADLDVVDSSGSQSFNTAAQEAMQQWRFDPPEIKHDSTILINFVFERSKPKVTRGFSRRYLHIKNLVDDGRFSEASQALDKLSRDRLYPTELAYVWLARAYMADARGDKDEQLACFRKVMISDGQWVTRELYLELLRATTILGLQTEDYASAVRDYDKLMESPVGRKLGADLGPAIDTARSLAAGGMPFVMADSQLVVRHQAPTLGGTYDFVRPPLYWPDRPRQPSAPSPQPKQ